MVESTFRCGLIAVAGRPNVGKSSLVNALVGNKVSIVSPKPQTTRHRIMGIHNVSAAQLIFVDMPGLHAGGKRALNRQMNRIASSSLGDADAIIMVAEALRWTAQDTRILQQCRQTGRPFGLVVNKTDTVKPKLSLLPYLEQLQSKLEQEFVIPVSALEQDNLAELEQLLTGLLPVSPPLFPMDQFTDQSTAMRISELVREQLMLALEQEIPYSVAAQVETVREEEGILQIGVTIWVEREGQKAVVIGKQGAMLKRIGRAARLELQRSFGRKIFLQLWVKVRANWADDERALRQLGIEPI